MIVRWTVLAFSVVLLLAGAIPFFVPAGGATSSAPAYAAFHLAGALFGFAAVAWRRGQFAPLFSLVFGVLDLYQALASAASWFPKDLFGWTPVDDGLHWVLGAVLILLGATGWVYRKRSS